MRLVSAGGGVGLPTRPRTGSTARVWPPSGGTLLVAGGGVLVAIVVLALVLLSGGSGVARSSAQSPLLGGPPRTGAVGPLFDVGTLPSFGTSWSVSPVPAGAAPTGTAPTGRLPDVAGGVSSGRFEPGNIISDQVFYNSSAMTEQQVRTFIAAQGAGCAGQLCLKNRTWTLDPGTADEFCAGYPGGAGLDAAAILSRLSTACGVNPQVMLVTLQKESSLLDRTDPTETNYDAAFGWFCPDVDGVAACDPAYRGFVTQTVGMAKQWSRYRVNPDNYQYRSGRTYSIAWDVDPACGSAPVTIRNTATASLYNYTPYQPNAASLAAYPGEGDQCSSYGIRNFWFLFQIYFVGGTAPAATTTP